MLFDRFGRLSASFVLNDLKRFDTNLVNKLIKNTFFLVLGHENYFYTVLSVFTSF